MVKKRPAKKKKNNRITLEGVIEFDKGLSRFEMIFEDGMFYAFYLADNLFDGIFSMDVFFEEFPDEYWHDREEYRNTKNGHSFKQWMKEHELKDIDCDS